MPTRKCVHVSSAEEYRELMEVATKMGYKWSSPINPSFEQMYGKTCIWFNDDGGKKYMLYSGYDYAVSSFAGKVESFREFMMEYKKHLPRSTEEILTSKAIKAVRNVLLLQADCPN